MKSKSLSLPLAAALMATGCSAGDEVGEPVQLSQRVDLRADNNRNGVVDLDDPSEDAGEDSWDQSHGAVFLANIDDDQEACPTKARDASMQADVELATCNDAADEVINGLDDLADLAPLQALPFPDAPEGARLSLSVSEAARPFVRLFVDRAGEFVVYPPGSELDSGRVQSGVEFRIEANDVVRDPDDWDGYVDVSLAVTQPGAETLTDTLRMRVAPVLTSHHLQPVRVAYATDYSQYLETAYQTELGEALAAAGVDDYRTLGGVEFDPWTQDFFETAWMGMPGPGGAQHVIDVMYRSANYDRSYYDPNQVELRVAGRVVFEQFRGADRAGVMQFDPAEPLDMDTLDSFGNLETIPPHEKDGVSYPFGRVLRGSVADWHPDESLQRMLEAQGMQPSIKIDTSWLLVSHVDETLSFLPDPSAPRGWVLAANDVALAKQMLEAAAQQGHGDALLFSGKSWLSWRGDDLPAEVSITDVLNDADVMASSAEAAVEVMAQLDVLKGEVGISDDEVVRVPFLHQPIQGYAVAYQPGTVNGIVMSTTDFASPRPHGPVIDGRDIFEVQLEQALAAHGITVHWVEDWDLLHRNDGEVHCGSNTLRGVPDARWWESGR